MSKNKNTWYKLIKLFREKDLIIDGLTIPFLLGAQKCLHPEMKITDKSVFHLLTEISGTENKECAVLKDCAGKQFIITLRNPDFCSDNLSNALAFQNKTGNNSFYVSDEASSLGNSLKEISKSLNEIYKGLFMKETFSWDDKKIRWNKLTDAEERFIQEAVQKQ